MWFDGPRELHFDSLGKDLLLPNTLSGLGRLYLFDVQFESFQDLFGAFNSCHKSLYSLTLHAVVICPMEDQWAEIFHYILDMPKLRNLGLAHLACKDENGVYHNLHVKERTDPMTSLNLIRESRNAGEKPFPEGIAGNERIKGLIEDILQRGTILRPFEGGEAKEYNDWY